MKIFFRLSFFVAAALATPLCVRAAPPPSIVIESVEIGSPAASDEYIVLRNTGASAIDISKWSLQNRSTGSLTVQKKNFTAGTILQPQDEYLIAHKDGRFAATAHMTYTTLSLLEKGGTLGLFATTTYATTFEETTLASLFNYSLVAGEAPTPTKSATTPTTNTKAVTSVPEFIGHIAEIPKKWPIKLNELFPNPTLGEEFIEIINTSGEGVDVSGLWLRDASGASYALGVRGENTVLGAYEMRIWKRSMTRLALNNTDGEVVLLIDQSGAVIDRVLYAHDAPDNAAYARFGNSWIWTTEPSPSNKNRFIAIEEPPVARAVIPAGPLRVGQSFKVSAADSTDPNDAIVEYLWNFGDGTHAFGVTSTHTFTTTGTYTISLDIIDLFDMRDVVFRKINVIAAAATPPTSTKNIKAVKAASVAGTLISRRTERKKATPTNPYYTGIVQIPPGLLGHRRFVMNGRTVEFTTDRKELPLLRRGSIIQFTAREIFKTDRMLLQVTAKDVITVKALTTAAPYTSLNGTVLHTDHASFGLAATTTDFLVLSGLRYGNGTRVSAGDIVNMQGVLLTDDANKPTFVVPAPQQLKLVSRNSPAIKAAHSSLYNFILLFASTSVFVLLHLFLTKYGKHFSPSSLTRYQIITTFVKRLGCYLKNFLLRNKSYDEN